MYPLILKAPLKDYIWGGNRLKNEFGFETDKDKVAEAWVLSCHKDGTNIVLNGEFAGKSLSEVIDIWGKNALGTNSKSFEYFPILIKLIDAYDKLSVQVHPDDEYALRVESEYGKTEMWYIVDCKPDAKLLYGFNHEISKEEFAQRIKSNTLDEVVNYVNVNKGDVFFITAGTLHAIGEGILIAEVQQNSNTTYRVSDYGRLGADGKPRELHVEKAKDVILTVPPTHPYGNIGNSREVGDSKIRELAKCDKFTAEHIALNGELDVKNGDSFVSLVVLEGSATILWDSDTAELAKGTSVFVPAGLAVKLCGKADILLSQV